MNKRFMYGLVATLLSSTLCGQSVEKSCCNVPQGPQGPQGANAPFGSTAFISSSFNSVIELAVNDNVPFPATSDILNITHPNDTNFVIQQSGYYYVVYGIASYPQSEGDLNSAFAIYVNNIQQPSTLLNIPLPASSYNTTLGSIGSILFLNAGDTVVVKNIVAPMAIALNLLGTTPDPYPISAYINFIRLASF